MECRICLNFEFNTNIVVICGETTDCFITIFLDFMTGRTGQEGPRKHFNTYTYIHDI